VRVLIELGGSTQTPTAGCDWTAAGASPIPDDLDTLLADVATAAAATPPRWSHGCGRCARDWSGAEPILGLLEGALLAPVLVQLHLRGGSVPWTPATNPFQPQPCARCSTCSWRAAGRIRTARGRG